MNTDEHGQIPIEEQDNSAVISSVARNPKCCLAEQPVMTARQRFGFLLAALVEMTSLSLIALFVISSVARNPKRCLAEQFRMTARRRFGFLLAALVEMTSLSLIALFVI